MSRYRKIYANTWGDAKFRALSERGKLLWFYLMTGPETTSLPGLLIGGQAHFAEALGWDPKAFREAFGEVFAKGMAKADWEARVVWLPKAIRYNKPESPNVVKSWRDHFDCVPECGLKAEALRVLRDYVEAMGEAFAKAFREAMPKDMPESGTGTGTGTGTEEEILSSLQTDEPKVRKSTRNGSKPSSEVERVFAYWATKLAPRAKLDSKRAGIIAKALETYSVEELCKAVDGTLLDDWRMGRAPRTGGKKFVGVELVFRSSEKIDPMIELADSSLDDSPYEELKPSGRMATTREIIDSSPEEHREVFQSLFGGGNG